MVSKSGSRVGLPKNDTVMEIVECMWVDISCILD